MRQPWLLWSLIAAALLLAATLLRPTLPLPRADYRYVFVLDITQSMNVADSTAGKAPPPSRLDYAKQAVSQALGELPCGSEAGLALFTAHRVLLLFMPVEVCAHLHELRLELAGIHSRLAWAAAALVASSERWPPPQ